MRRGYATSWINLSLSEAELRVRLHGKWRNALAAAERAGLKAAQASWSSGDAIWLLAREEAQRRDKRYRALPLGFLEHYLTAGGEILTLTASYQGQPIAGVLLLRHGASATYHIGYTSEEGRRLRAHHLLLWRAMLTLKESGVRWLDLGGLFAESSPGIARFKRGLGGKEALMPGVYV